MHSVSDKFSISHIMIHHLYCIASKSSSFFFFQRNLFKNLLIVATELVILCKVLFSMIVLEECCLIFRIFWVFCISKEEHKVFQFSFNELDLRLCIQPNISVQCVFRLLFVDKSFPTAFL